MVCGRFSQKCFRGYRLLIQKKESLSLKNVGQYAKWIIVVKTELFLWLSFRRKCKEIANLWRFSSDFLDHVVSSVWRSSHQEAKANIASKKTNPARRHICSMALLENHIMWAIFWRDLIRLTKLVLSAATAEVHKPSFKPFEKRAEKSGIAKVDELSEGTWATSLTATTGKVAIAESSEKSAELVWNEKKSFKGGTILAAQSKVFIMLQIPFSFRKSKFLRTKRF